MKQPFTRDSWLSLLGAVSGICSAVFDLNWKVRILFVAVAIGAIVYAALHHDGRKYLRAGAVLFASLTIIGLSWGPIWRGFRSDYPNLEFRSPIVIREANALEATADSSFPSKVGYPTRWVLMAFAIHPTAVIDTIGANDVSAHSNYSFGGPPIAMIRGGSRISIHDNYSSSCDRSLTADDIRDERFRKLSNDDLRSQTLGLVRKIRDLQFQLQEQSEPTTAGAGTDAGFQEQIRRENLAEDEAKKIFAVNYRSDALALWAELVTRTQSDHLLSRYGGTLNAGFISEFGLEEAADSLERLARKLP